MYKYFGKMHRVVDGDTFIIDVDLGFEVFTRITFRLLNLDTFETRLIKETTEQDKQLGLKIKHFAKEILDGKDVEIHTKLKKGFYKRYLCDLYFQYDGSTIFYNNMMKNFGADKHIGLDESLISDQYKNLWEKYRNIVK